MSEEREIISLLLGIGVLAFMVRQRQILVNIPYYGLLQSAFLLLFASLTCSVVEEWILNALLNDLQHVTSALSAVVLAIWCWFASQAREAPA